MSDFCLMIYWLQIKPNSAAQLIWLCTPELMKVLPEDNSSEQTWVWNRQRYANLYESQAWNQWMSWLDCHEWMD